MSQPASDSPPEGRPPDGRDAPARGDTRSRIQAVAVELFSEQGYDKTSLREIAERLGVTKAALYYHFKSKEDIVRSLIDDYFGQVDALAAWAREQPRTPAVRAEILSRYLDMVIDSHQIYRMLQQNQAALAGLTSEKHRGELFKERMNALIDLLVEPGAALRERVRAAVATTGLSIGWMLFHDRVDDLAELRSAVLGIAFELAGGAAEGGDHPRGSGVPAEAADQPGEVGGPPETAGQPGEVGGPPETAGQPGESRPGPAWPPAAARTNGSTR